MAVVGGIVSITAYKLLEEHNQKESLIQEPINGSLTSMPGSNTANSTDFAFAAEKSIHAVVHVKTKQHQDSYYNNLYDFFFGDVYKYTPQPITASGSGVIISSNGYIVTNNHVIDGSDYIEVVLNDKSKYKASLVGTDQKTDIALLKIEAYDLPFLTYGDSDGLSVGEWVLAVGNPFNLTSTVTAGIVSAKARNINILSHFAIESFIQTDAAVNPGNSGGALVNTKGDLVGINTAIASNTGSYAGYSFAIPVNIVKKIVADIIEFGEVQRAYIGVYPKEITQEIAEEMNLSSMNGIYVDGINENGAAAAAGIQDKDIITNISDFPVNNVPQLQEQVSKYRPGDKVNVKFIRDGEEKTVVVELRNRQGNTSIIKSSEISIMGARFGEISNEEKSRLRLRNGVKVIELKQGELLKAGIKQGFIITQINKVPVYSGEDVYNLLSSIEGVVLVEGIYPNGISVYYTFGI